MGWVNGMNYEKTTEIFGILPIPRSLKNETGMQDYNPALLTVQKSRHNFLAKAHATLFAVLPVHTREEKALYSALVRTSSHFDTGKKEPNWTAIAMEWTSHCDGVKIFYKVPKLLPDLPFRVLIRGQSQLPEHLKNYFKDWKKTRNISNSIETHKDTYDTIRSMILEQVGIPKIIAGLPKTLADSIPPLLSQDRFENPAEMQYHMQAILSRNSLRLSDVDAELEEAVRTHQRAALSLKNQSGKRKSQAIAEPVEGPASKRKKTTTKTRQERHCKGCGTTECQGRWNIRNCAVKFPLTARRILNHPKTKGKKHAHGQKVRVRVISASRCMILTPRARRTLNPSAVSSAPDEDNQRR